MKRIKLLILVSPLFFLIGCAATQNPQKPTWYMDSESKIQYYQEQIDHYNFLIEQEQKKLNKK